MIINSVNRSYHIINMKIVKNIDQKKNYQTSVVLGVCVCMYVCCSDDDDENFLSPKPFPFFLSLVYISNE